MKNKTTIPVSNEHVSLLELKFLMSSILTHHANIRIKCLLDGGSWTEHYLSVVMVTEKGVVLSDETTNKIRSIKFLNQVMQFVLDRSFDSYRSNLAYVVNAA